MGCLFSVSVLMSTQSVVYCPSSPSIFLSKMNLMCSSYIFPIGELGVFAINISLQNYLYRRFYTGLTTHPEPPLSVRGSPLAICNCQFQSDAEPSLGSSLSTTYLTIAGLPVFAERFTTQLW